MYISQYLPPDIGNSFCLVVRNLRLGTERSPFLSRRQKVVTRGQKNTQQLSVPLKDGSTKYHVNSIFCDIHQMAALQVLQQRISPNSKSMTHFIAQKACDTFHSTKSMTHFTARKVYDHFIAQSLHVPAHHQSRQQSAHMHAAHRFLDIQIISNKLGVAPVAHRATPSYSDVY
ncbi:hypothetical protein AVEN_14486-1 [Araneus ventricosus]|uniref:Uncharacterized protein n=1 Tax=Araneus ventricosus TaxID=182803 RepID=A0A4Y2UYL6_ARAVE|nr:hypothetical protein AVEN_14486-1 [Araneus ventricosus]